MYLDFSKAFDLVSHCLFVKIENLDNSRKKSKHFKILTDRTMKVKISKNHSETQNIPFWCSSGDQYWDLCQF